MKRHSTFALVATMLAAAPVLTACGDEDNTFDPTEADAKERALAAANAQFVNETVLPTYAGLADATEEMIGALERFAARRTQADLDEAAALWRQSRQYWEWSEAFLFGAASGYGIDPHIDTWPFDVAQFDNFLGKYHPATSAADAAAIDEIVATGQNLTGFHAVEYLLFRQGSVRPAAELSADEAYFCRSAARDLYRSACRLLVAWGGEASAERMALLEDAEMVPEDDFGAEFRNAGRAGSRWATVTLAAIQMVEGCRSIVDEVAHAKIGAPATGEDVHYIESPHAYNSIQDFYDNLLSCRHVLCGGLGRTAPAAGSLMAYALAAHPAEAAATEAALVEALAAIRAMKAPFVLHYNDPSARTAIAKTEALDDALAALQKALED